MILTWFEIGICGPGEHALYALNHQGPSFCLNPKFRITIINSLKFAMDSMQAFTVNSKHIRALTILGF